MRYWVIEQYLRRGLWECSNMLKLMAVQETWLMMYCVLTAGIVVQVALLLGLAEVVLKELINDLFSEDKLYIWLRKR